MKVSGDGCVLRGWGGMEVGNAGGMEVGNAGSGVLWPPSPSRP